jgi:hypothetical protein
MVQGTLIAESLGLHQPLDTRMLTIESVRRVGPLEGVAVGQPAVWTFVEFSGDDAHASSLADALAGALDPAERWYCDFRTDAETWVVFAGAVFCYPRGDAPGRAGAVAHARALGVPEAQIDWPE